MRLSSEFWISAYIRQCQTDGDFAALTERGAAHGGAIFVVINRLDGLFDLYGPAPQSLLGDKHDKDDRVFYQLLGGGTEADTIDQLQKEKRFDADLWVIERESRTAKHGLVVVD